MRVFAICLCWLLFVCVFATADNSQQDLFKSVLTTTPSNLPSGLTVVSMKSITDFDSDAKKAGLTNEVEIKFAGADDKTFVNYYFFSSADAVAAWDKQYFADMHPGKQLSTPMGAQCANFPNGSGYCDFVAQDLTVLITTRGPASIAEELMKSAYDNLITLAKKATPSQ